MKGSNNITAFAPATIANVFVGYDILGFAIKDMRDEVSLTKIVGRSRISSITGIDEDIPYDIEKNTAGQAILAMTEGLDLDFGFDIRLHKGIPLASGLGGSAASAVAAVVAANSFLEEPLSRDELLQFALEGERVASGSLHGDNVAACLFGGLTAFLYFNHNETEPYKVLRLPVIDSLEVIVIHPHIQIKTKDARNILSKSVDLETFTQQSMRLLSFLAGSYERDIKLFQDGLSDLVIEPQRSELIPEFPRIKTTCMQAGAMGFSIAGAGPTMFAFADRSRAQMIVDEIELLEADLSYEIDVWKTGVHEQGATLRDF